MSKRKLDWKTIAERKTHPLEIEILKLLHADNRPASPKELAALTGERLGNVAYHVRRLHAAGLLEVDRLEPRRGASEHFYRLSKDARS